jgi:hypothetical protein
MASARALLANHANGTTNSNSEVPSYSFTPNGSNDFTGSSSGGGEKEKGKERDNTTVKVKRNWYGKKIGVVSTPADGGVGSLRDDEEYQGPEPRRMALFAPVYNGVAAALACGKQAFFSYHVLFLC